MKKDKRFIEVLNESIALGFQSRIVVDSHTGVNYLYCVSGYSGGLTPLLNRDGTPVITPVVEQDK